MAPMFGSLRRLGQRILLPDSVRELKAQQNAIIALQRRVRQMNTWAKEHERFVATALAQQGVIAEHQLEQRRVVRRTVRLTASKRAIIVGPWSGEVGFELLYWIPFLNKLVRRRSLGSERLVVVSRGGVGEWYKHLASRYVDLFDLLSPEEFRQYGSTWKKQTQLLPMDRRLIKWGARTAHLSRPHVLHPQLMYRMLVPYWKNEPVAEGIGEYVEHRRMEKPTTTQPPGLPSKYVAVRFYFSNSFPDTADNRQFVNRTVDQLSERLPVVMLRSGSRLDDHDDARASRNDRIFEVAAEPVRENLAIQSAVIANASAFVGTYGGFSYLAPYYGVKSLSFYSNPEQLVRFHLDYAQDVFSRMGESFVAMDTRHAGFVAESLGQASAVESR